MSGGILEDVSILDLPAFAHSIGTLEKSQKRESGWPTELNFAIRNGKKGAGGKKNTQGEMLKTQRKTRPKTQEFLQKTKASLKTYFLRFKVGTLYHNLR